MLLLLFPVLQKRGGQLPPLPYRSYATECGLEVNKFVAELYTICILKQMSNISFCIFYITLLVGDRYDWFNSTIAAIKH